MIKFTGAKENASAQRVRPPSWRDPRLLVGLLLVVGSVLAVVFIGAQLSRTTTVYIAKEKLSYGQPLTEDKLALAEVNLNELQQRYLPADQPLAPGSYLVRPVGEGEMISADAVTDQPGRDRQSVVVRVLENQLNGLNVGNTAEVWVAERKNGQDYEPPQKKVSEVIIGSIKTHDNSLAVDKKYSVQLWVAAHDVPEILKAQAQNSQIFILGRTTSP